MPAQLKTNKTNSAYLLNTFLSTVLIYTVIVIEVSKVLQVVGGLSLFIAILYIMVGICGKTCSAVECCRICALASCPVIVVAGLAQFGVQIWASVVVFGKFVQGRTLLIQILHWIKQGVP